MIRGPRELRARNPRTISALLKRIYSGGSQGGVMAKMVSCPCGWTLISPQGDEDVKKHTMIHVQDTHPGMTMTQDDLTKMIKSV
jgi:predicted small metal-binding protein